MSTISDLLKLLDKIPVWKTLNELPSQIKSLENRLKKLEDKLTGKSGTLCPKCGSINYAIIKCYPDPNFSTFGKNRIKYECSDCGHTREALE
ncbi:MAG: hypothetical protein HQ528_04095 [Candidatus Marinimicrobia bacterium]|nr:hypothetical protein [Candidatus Neomarinimicrobiota bacterium]